MRWQKSSYCGEGESCVHVAATPQAIHITETSDPTHSILTTTPVVFAALLATLKNEPHPGTGHPTLHLTATDANTLRLHTTDAPTTAVTTDHPKWNAFVLGVRAGEFDHFVEEAEHIDDAPGRTPLIHP
ncbi:DUF397 domain-containing protein [Streptomyces sp. NPDC006739]|uniref:DUF397 domain-containing protein n=1 Tax=Streptomyces sp. NPDC006739 TaxID=3364763 RepID=UPI00367FAE06